MSKKITCEYQLSKELLGEYVRQLKHSHRVWYVLLSIILIVYGILGLTGSLGGVFLPHVLLFLGILLLITVILYSDVVMTYRMASRYRMRFGGVDIPVKVVFSSAIVCTLNGIKMTYRYDGVQRITETDNLLVINYLTNAVLVKKDALPKGVSATDVKELVLKKNSASNDLTVAK